MNNFKRSILITNKICLIFHFVVIFNMLFNHKNISIAEQVCSIQNNPYEVMLRVVLESFGR